MSELLADILPEAQILEGLDAEEEEENAELETQNAEGEEEEISELETQDAEEEEDAEDEEEHEEQPKNKDWPDSARKRVDKLTAKLREAEAKAAELEAKATGAANQQTEQNPNGNAPATTGGPLDDVWQTEDLTGKAQSALAWKQWAIENPDGGTLKLGDQEREYSEEDVKRILINSDRLLNVEIPQRWQFLSKAAQYESGLRGEFPEFFQEDSEEWKGILGAFQELPVLKQRPDGTGLAMMLALGLKEFARLRESKKSKVTTKAKVPVNKPKLAPRPVEPAAAASAPGPKSGKIAKQPKSLDAILASGGDVDSLESFFTT